MKAEERSGFLGLMTNVAESKAPPGALIEAQNVVIRRPNSIEPRDGVLVDSRLDGTELVAYSFADKDYIGRSVASAIEYRELGGGAPLTNAPQPFRRDILTRAEARGNLYTPAFDGVWKLVPNGTAFQRSGIVLSVNLSHALSFGPVASENVLGVTGFLKSSYLENAAGQGPLQAANFWIAIQFFLRAMPVPAVNESFLSRGRGTHPASNAYQIQMVDGKYYYSQYIAGAGVDASVPIAPEHVGRMNLLVYARNGGSSRLWINGVGGTAVVMPALATDPADIATWGNSRVFGPMPLQSAVLVNAARGTAAITQSNVDALMAATKAYNRLTIPADMLPTHYWMFQTIPPLAPIGGEAITLTGPTPAFQSVPTLWPGDPEVYPEQYWLPRGYHVAYRAVGYSKDASGVVRRSAPSAAYEVAFPENMVSTPDNSSGAYVTLDVRAGNTDVPAYEQIEIYRSRVYPIDVAIDDEMQLVGTVDALTWPAVSTLVDDMPQHARGATLYTSPSRGGIATQQNDPPPACACVALFKGSLFFGNTRGPATLTLSFTLSGSLAGQAQGIGNRDYSGTSTFGSATINLSSTVGIQPGMYVNGPGFTDPAPPENPPYVVSVTASAVVVSVPATSLAAAGNFLFKDVLWINDRMIAPEGVRAAGFVVPGISVQQIIPPQNGEAQTWILSSVSRAPVAAPYVVRATHGDQYVPPLPLFSQSAQPWSQDTDPGKLMWSKTDEPEHVPPLNYAFVGERRKAILGLVPTRDALYVLKEDGIWRLTGANATWRIDPFDPTTFCVLPNSVKPLFGRGAFLSRKGVVCVGDAGVELISGSIHDLWRPIVDGILTRFATTGLYELENCIGSCAAVFERENEYSIMRAKGLPALVYNQNTRVWTAWDYARASSEPGLQLSALNSFGRSDRVVYSLSLRGALTALTDHIPLAAAINTTYRADSERAATVSAVDAATGLVTVSASVNLAEGDILIDAAANLFVVVSIVSASQFYVKTTAQNALGQLKPVVGSGYLYRSMRCRVVPAGFMNPASLQKHFRAIVKVFPTMVGGCDVRIGYQSSLDPTWVSEDARVYAPKGYLNMPMGYHNSALVPRAHARSWNLHAAIEWSHAFGNARLEAVFAESGDILPDSPSEVEP